MSLRRIPDWFRSFGARVTRFANAIDVASRTMRTEVRLDAPRGELLPGMYAQARFEFERKKPPVVIPANTLLPSPDGDRVVAARDGVARFHTIHVAQDHGAQLEVLDGVAVGDTLIMNVGEKVRVISRANEGRKQ